MLTKNNLDIEQIDKNGNIIKSTTNGKYSNKIEKELRMMHKDLRVKQAALKSANKTLASLEYSLQEELEFYKTIKAKFDKYSSAK